MQRKILLLGVKNVMIYRALNKTLYNVIDEQNTYCIFKVLPVLSTQKDALKHTCTLSSTNRLNLYLKYTN